MKTPLRRPDVPRDLTPTPWPGPSIAVVGDGAREFAAALNDALRGRGVEVAQLLVELRHAPGFEREGERLRANPDALLEGLEAARGELSESALTIGVGAGFGCAVAARHTVWIDGGGGPSLGPALRDLARRATLTLRRPDLEVARALAEAWAGQ